MGLTLRAAAKRVTPARPMSLSARLRISKVVTLAMPWHSADKRPLSRLQLSSFNTEMDGEWHSRAPRHSSASSPAARWSALAIHTGLPDRSKLLSSGHEARLLHSLETPSGPS